MTVAGACADCKNTLPTMINTNCKNETTSAESWPYSMPYDNRAIEHNRSLLEKFQEMLKEAEDRPADWQQREREAIADHAALRRTNAALRRKWVADDAAHAALRRKWVAEDAAAEARKKDAHLRKLSIERETKKYHSDRLRKKAAEFAKNLEALQVSVNTLEENTAATQTFLVP